MSANKWTPGPWVNLDSGDMMCESYSQPFAIAQSGVANLIAGVFGDVKGGTAVARYNARLIAAAPELVEALEKCATAIEHEVNADGSDDHPVLKDHRRTAERARALLARIREG